jgi:uncharacterized protein YuzE
MNVTYDKETDSLTMIFSNAAIAESDEEKPGVILDYDDAGNLVSMEIPDASRRVNAPEQMD